MYQKSTCLTQLTVGPYVVQIGARYARNVEPTKPSKFTVREAAGAAEAEAGPVIECLYIYHMLFTSPLCSTWARTRGQYPSQRCLRRAFARTGRPLHPTPYTLHPTPYTLHPTPYTLHPTLYTLNLTPSTLHPTPYSPRVRGSRGRSESEVWVVGLEVKRRGSRLRG